MREDKPEDTKVVKRRFDDSERTLEGRLYSELEWERLLKTRISENKRAKILDAGGGVGEGGSGVGSVCCDDEYSV